MKYLFATVFLLSLTVNSAVGQSVSSLSSEDAAELPSTIIKFNPFELISSTFMMEVEKLSSSKSGSTSFGVGVTYAEMNDYESESVFGVKGELIQRIYFSPFSQRESKKGNSYLYGVYGGLFVRGGYEEIESEFYSYYDDVNSRSVYETNVRSGYWVFPGALMGLSRTYFDKLLVDFYVGAGIRAISVKNTNSRYEDLYYYSYHISPLDYGGVAPNIGIKLGLWL